MGDDMVTAKTDVAPVRLLSPRSWLQGAKAVVKHFQGRRMEFNYASIEGHIHNGASVIEIGSWDCLFPRLLRDRKGCKMLCVDVVDKNETDLPLRLFDGRTLPLEAGEKFDVVTLLYVLHHASEDEVLLREAVRACAPTGCVLVAEDMVETWFESIITVGFHVVLLLATGMGWSGRFRKMKTWEARFDQAGLRIKQVVFLGHHIGKWWWPKNVLYVLQPH
jgi:SAM-dependent methyltransferase